MVSMPSISSSESRFSSTCFGVSGFGSKVKGGIEREKEEEGRERGGERERTRDR